MKIKSILCALLLMVSSMASAQYLNIKQKHGPCWSFPATSSLKASFEDKNGQNPYLNIKWAEDKFWSFKATPNLEIFLGEKAGQNLMESVQVCEVGGYRVMVKLTDDIPESEVKLNASVEGDKVKISAVSNDNWALTCIRDDYVSVPDPDVSNGIQTFTISEISKNVIVTFVYATVKFDLNNPNMEGGFKAPTDITRIKYNSTIAPTYAFAENYGFRGWYKDKDCTEAWNYSAGVTNSITLYAKWAEDPAENKINGHDYVKLGGYYWATENYDHFLHSQSNAISNIRKWNSSGNDDHSWTLPSYTQWQALLDCCDWEWTTNYNHLGKTGYLVRGKAETYESGHSIFLSAEGIRIDFQTSEENEIGYYWSTGNYCFIFNLNNKHIETDSNKDHQMAMRPVAE